MICSCFKRWKLNTANSAYNAYLREFPDHQNETVKVDLPLRGMVIIGGNDNFIGFGQEIIFPVEGIVEIVVVDIVDKSPQTNYSLGDANYISIRDDKGYHCLFMHNKMRSARVKPGERVMPGDVLAELRNTGMTYILHLHFGIYAKEWVLSVPVRFKNFYKIKKDGRKVKITEGVPEPGDIIESVR